MMSPCVRVGLGTGGNSHTGDTLGFSLIDFEECAYILGLSLAGGKGRKKKKNK